MNGRQDDKTKLPRAVLTRVLVSAALLGATALAYQATLRSYTAPTVPREALNEDLRGVRALQLEVRSIGGRARLYGSRQEALQGVSLGDWPVKRVVSRRDGVLSVRYMHGSLAAPDVKDSNSGLPDGSAFWPEPSLDLQMPTKLPIDLSVRQETGDVELLLKDLDVRTVDVDGGRASVDVSLPARASTVRVKSGGRVAVRGQISGTGAVPSGTLDVDSGQSPAFLALTDAGRMNIALKSGSGPTYVFLPSAFQATLNVKRGPLDARVFAAKAPSRLEARVVFGDVSLQVPRTGPVRLETSAAPSRVSVPAGFVRRGDVYEREGKGPLLTLRVTADQGKVAVREVPQ